MAATPQPCTVVFYNPSTKQKMVRSAINVDITTNLWTWEDGTTTLAVPVGFTYIIDIMQAAAVVDCRTSTIRINNIQIGRIVMNNANLATAINRPFQQVPLQIPSGSSIAFVNVT